MDHFARPYECIHSCISVHLCLSDIPTAKNKKYSQHRNKTSIFVYNIFYVSLFPQQSLEEELYHTMFWFNPTLSGWFLGQNLFVGCWVQYSKIHFVLFPTLKK